MTSDGLAIIAAASGAVFRSDNDRLRLLSLQPSRITAVAISPATNIIAVSLDVSDKIAILDVNGVPLYSLSSRALSNVESLSFNPNGTLLSVGHENGVLEIFDMSSRSNIKLFAAHGAPIHRTQFSPTSTFLASADINGNVNVWELRNIRLISHLSQLSLPSFQATGRISYLDFSADENLILTVYGNFVDLWDRETGKRVDHFESIIQSLVLAGLSAQSGIIAANESGTIQTFSFPFNATFSPTILETLAPQ